MPLTLPCFLPTDSLSENLTEWKYTLHSVKLKSHKGFDKLNEDFKQNKWKLKKVSS